MQEIRLNLPEELQRDINLIKSQIEDLKKNFEPKDPPQYLTRQEVADMFRINLSTVHNWTKRGILISVGIGGRRYFLRSDIEKVIVKL